MPVRGRLTLLAVLLAGAGLAACGDDATTEAASTTTETITTTAADRPPSDGTITTAGGVEVPEFLDFVAPDVRGGQVTGAELAGQDLVVWFWAPW